MNTSLHTTRSSFACCLLAFSSFVLAAQDTPLASGGVTNFPPGVVQGIAPPVPEDLLTNRSVTPEPELKREIRPVPGGAVADFGRSKIRWPYDVGAMPVAVSRQNGTRLSFRASAIVLADRRTGENYLLASITNCVGEIVGDSAVRYSGAFDSGAVRASLRYEYDWRHDSLEQYITLEKLNLPGGLEAKHLRVECWTEWFEGDPVSLRTSRLVTRESGVDGPNKVEEDNIELDFGGIKVVGKGRAFALGEEDAGVPVAKSWVQLTEPSHKDPQILQPTARRFLIEAFDYLTAKPRLDKLGKTKGSASFEGGKSKTALLALIGRGAKQSLPLVPDGSEPRVQVSPIAAMVAKVSGSSALGAASGFTIDFCLQSCVAPPSGIISWWEGQNNALDSVGGNHGAANGINYVDGEVEQSFGFNGTGENVTVPDASSLDFGQFANFSIEGWIKPEAAVTDFGVQTIADKRDTGDPYSAVGYALYLIDGKLGFQLAQASQYTCYGPVGGNLCNDPPTWYHIAVTVDRGASDGLRFYINGSQVEDPWNPTGQTGDLSNDLPLLVGKHAQAGLDAGFKGAIDELAIYSRALSAQEIQAIFNAGWAGKCGQCSCSLSDAVDQPGWAFNTGGGGPWFAQTTIAQSGGDAAQSGGIQNGQTTYLETTVTGPGTLGFFRKISSQAGSDYLKFYVGGQQQSAVSGELDWSYGNYSIPPGPQTVRWEYSKDSSGSAGADAAWIDFIYFTPQSPCSSLGDAVDNSSIYLSTGGDGWWSCQSTTYHSGNDAAQSGALGNGQSTYMETTVNGPAMLNFWWSVSSEAGYDLLRFYIDGGRRDEISGARDWSERTFMLEEGAHTVRWEYSKDGSVSSGADAGWVDLVEVITPAPPTITLQPQSQTVPQNGAVTFSVAASGFPLLSYLWTQNGWGIPGPNTSQYSSRFSIVPVQPTDAGSYRVSVQNDSGSTLSSAASLTVTLPAPCLTSPEGFVGWWPADGNGDNVAGTGTAILRDGAVYSPGLVGSAFDFNGSTAYAEVPDNAQWNLGYNNFTIEFWVKFRSWSPSGETFNPEAIFVGSDEPGYYTRKWFFALGDGQLHFYEGRTFAIATFTPDLDIWYHLALVRSANTLHIYRNGELLESVCDYYPYSVPDPSGPLTIGQCENRGFIDGRIDELTIYHRALSQEELSSIYRAGGAGKCGFNDASDPDYDGVPNGVDTDPNNPDIVQPVRLAAFNFNTAGFPNERNQLPRPSNPSSPSVVGWVGNAVKRTEGTLIYNAVEDDATANINCRKGMIRFRFAPQWSETETAFVTGTTLGTLRHDFSGFVGMKFTVGANPITVTALGRWVVAGNSRTHVVKLVRHYDSTDVPGGAATVDTSGATAGQFQYAALPSPVVLSAGVTYCIVSQEASGEGEDSWYDYNTTVTTTPVATVASAVFSWYGGWTSAGGTGHTYVPVSFLYAEAGSGPIGTRRDLMNVGNGWRISACVEEVAGQPANYLRFYTSDGSAETLLISTPITWQKDQWYQICLTYGPSESVLYINGVKAQTGAGLPYYPPAWARNQYGFSIGSAPTGESGDFPANGLFDELETFNYEELRKAVIFGAYYGRNIAYPPNHASGNYNNFLTRAPEGWECWVALNQWSPTTATRMTSINKVARIWTLITDYNWLTADHQLQIGDQINISGMGGTGYNHASVTVTDVYRHDADYWLTYPNIGPDTGWISARGYLHDHNNTFRGDIYKCRRQGNVATIVTWKANRVLAGQSIALSGLEESFMVGAVWPNTVAVDEANANGSDAEYYFDYTAPGLQPETEQPDSGGRITLNGINTCNGPFWTLTGAAQSRFAICLNYIVRGAWGGQLPDAESAVNAGMAVFSPHYDNIGAKFQAVFSPSPLRSPPYGLVPVSGGCWLGLDQATRVFSFGPEIELFDAVWQGAADQIQCDCAESWAHAAVGAKYATMRDKYPGWNVFDLRQLLRQTSTHYYSSPSWDENNGYGFPQIANRTGMAPGFVQSPLALLNLQIQDLEPGSPLHITAEIVNNGTQVNLTWKNFAQTDFFRTKISRVSNGQEIYTGTGTSYAWFPGQDIRGQHLQVRFDTELAPSHTNPCRGFIITLD